MPARPCSKPSATERLLIIGVAALLCGLSLVAAGLSYDEGALEIAPPGALRARVTAGEHSTLRPFVMACACERSSGRPAVATGGTTTLIALGATPIQAPRRPREHIAGDGRELAGKTSGDARNELLRTAALRWLRATKSSDDTSIDSSLEASRAAREEHLWAWAPIH